MRANNGVVRKAYEAEQNHQNTKKEFIYTFTMLTLLASAVISYSNTSSPFFSAIFAAGVAYSALKFAAYSSESMRPAEPPESNIRTLGPHQAAELQKQTKKNVQEHGYPGIF